MFVAWDKKARAPDRLGCFTYLRPRTVEGQRHGWRGTPVRFEPVAPAPASLVGAYDLVYLYGSTGGGLNPYSRSTRGSLILRMTTEDDTDGEEESHLRGEVTMHPEIRTTLPFIFTNDFAFTTSRHENDERTEDERYGEDQDEDSVHFRVTRCPFPEFPLDSILPRGFVPPGLYDDVCDGSIRVMRDRAAVPWSPHDDALGAAIADDARRVPVFETVEEAERIVVKIRNRCADGKSWMCRRLGLPSSLAELVREFVSSRPPPVLFFERGDLWLQVVWDSNDGSESILVARPRRGAEGTAAKEASKYFFRKRGGGPDDRGGDKRHRVAEEGR